MTNSEDTIRIVAMTMLPMVDWLRIGTCRNRIEDIVSVYATLEFIVTAVMLVLIFTFDMGPNIAANVS